VVALVSRLIWPWLKLDAISVGLLIVAIIPWVSGLFESLEFPGGWKISFRKLESAAQEIPDPPPTELRTEDEPSYLAVRGLDPQLGLVALRIEIERRLQRLAAQHGQVLGGRPPGVRRLLNDLRRAGVVPPNVAGALDEILIAGNAAAHGAALPSGQEDFAFSEGPRILAWLDSIEDHRDTSQTD